MPSSTTESYLQLLGLAVHEFRTPASVVGGYLRMLQRDAAGELNDRQRKMIDEAEKSCARLVTLIAEMSDVAKLDSGVIALARQPVDIFALVSDVAEHVQEARDREVRLEVRGEEGAAHVNGDATRLRAAFDAIFRAVLREKGGPCVVVAERRRETQNGTRAVVVVVSDAATVQAAYERERGAFDEKRGGMGLALPLARRVIEGHGGRLTSPAPIAPPDAAQSHDPLAVDPVSRGSAIITLPLTE
jgi:signal transduction histidine kinase